MNEEQKKRKAEELEKKLIEKATKKGSGEEVDSFDESDSSDNSEPDIVKEDG